jgi:hypothetical protein
MMSKLALILTFCALALSAHAETWHVGPARQYKVPSAVMALVADGDSVLIDSGLYLHDVGTWFANDLVLRCPKGYAHLEAQGTAASHKGIWVIDGNNTYVEGIEFSGCAISEADGSNGAGIRFESHKLECRRCYFHDNQEGILTGNDTTNEIVIEACEFDHNGVETGGNAGFQHNIYVGHSRYCRIAFCYFHRAIVGHEIKTRANRNFILYNFIVDDTDGDGSYSIDMPNGGASYVIGNAIEKGPNTENSTVIEYGGEGLINPWSILFVANNTFVTNRQPTTFFYFQKGSGYGLYNNIFAGGSKLVSGDTESGSNHDNVFNEDTSFFHFRDVRAYDYHVVRPFPGYNSGTGFGTTGPGDWTANPHNEYVHPLDSIPRDHYTANGYEIGAFNVTPSSNGVSASLSRVNLSNFPNPFDRTTTISLSKALSGPEECVVLLYDISGFLISRSSHIAFNSQVALDRSSLASGVYYYSVANTEGIEYGRGTLVVK